jgi:hypothetical protein
MERRIPLFAAVTFVGFFPVGAPDRAQDASADPAPMISVISTEASQPYPQVTCTSSDALAIADTLQLAADTRNQLSSLLTLSGPHSCHDAGRSPHRQNQS